MPLVACDGSFDALRQCVERGGLVGLLPDQRPASGRASIAARFLGRAAAGFSPGLARLHACTGAPVWVAFLLLDGPGERGPATRLRLERLAPRRTRDAAAAAVGADGGAALTQAYADALAEAVQRAPAQYLWLHRR